VFLVEAGFEPARVIAIDTLDGEVIVSLKLLHFNMIVVRVFRRQCVCSSLDFVQKEPLLELAGFADEEGSDSGVRTECSAYKVSNTHGDD
jgi:hypothetical protein